MRQPNPGADLDATALGPVARRRWYTATRWYEAIVVRDLLGDWTVVRRWGGRTNHLHGQLTEVVRDYPAARRRLDAIDAQRHQRPTPYQSCDD